MRKRNIRLLAALAAALCALAAAAVGAMLTSSGGGEGAAGAAQESLAEEAQEFLRSSSRQATRGTPLPMAREKLAGSKEAAREIWAGPSAEVYADHAYPHASIDFAQVEAALAQAKAFGRKGDSLKSDWEEVGPFTLDVAREATQTNGIPTQWAGRTTALAVDPRCNEDACRLYIGAAGGGVWRTDNALSRRPSWRPLTDGLDTTSVGHILIDPHDKSGKTIYLGTGEPSGSGDSEPGLGLYKSTDRGEHWSLVPGSRAVAKDRGIGEIAIDPSNPRHIFIYVGEPDDGSTGGFFGIRYEVAAGKLPSGKTRLYVYVGANEADNDEDGALDEASRVLRTDDARAAAPTFVMLSSSVDGTPGFSSFDICGGAVLLRHADRIASRQAGRGLDRRRHPVRRASALRGGRPLQRPERAAVHQRRRVLHRHVRRCP